MNRRAKFMLGAAVIVAAVGALVYTAARETSSYYMTMDEYAADPAAHKGEPLRLAGRVASGSVKWNPTTLDLEFVIQPIPPGVPPAGMQGASASAAAAAPVAAAAGQAPSAASRLSVRYNGVLPDMFGDGRDVIVEGRVESGVFHAKALLTTCPSKYEAERYETEADAEAPGPVGGSGA